MNERLEEMNIQEFEYMLREQEVFLKRLIKHGVSDEALEEIEEKLEVIKSTLSR